VSDEESDCLIARPSAEESQRFPAPREPCGVFAARSKEVMSAREFCGIGLPAGTYGELCLLISELISRIISRNGRFDRSEF
jgi:hypothetical protein